MTKKCKSFGPAGGIGDRSQTLVRGPWCKKGGLKIFYPGGEKNYHKFPSESWVYDVFVWGWPVTFHGKREWLKVFVVWRGGVGRKKFAIFFCIRPPYKCLNGPKFVLVAMVSGISSLESHTSKDHSLVMSEKIFFSFTLSKDFFSLFFFISRAHAPTLFGKQLVHAIALYWNNAFNGKNKGRKLYYCELSSQEGSRKYWRGIVSRLIKLIPTCTYDCIKSSAGAGTGDDMTEKIVYVIILFNMFKELLNMTLYWTWKLEAEIWRFSRHELWNN